MNYSDIDTIFIKPTNMINTYEYGINSAECSHTATRGEVFTMCYDILPGRRIKIIELLGLSVPFLLIVKDEDLYELGLTPITKDDYKAMMQDNVNKSTNDYINNNVNKKDKNDIMAEAIKKLATKKLFNSGGDYIG